MPDGMFYITSGKLFQLSIREKENVWKVWRWLDDVLPVIFNTDQSHFITTSGASWLQCDTSSWCDGRHVMPVTALWWATMHCGGDWRKYKFLACTELLASWHQVREVMPYFLCMCCSPAACLLSGQAVQSCKSCLPLCLWNRSSLSAPDTVSVNNI